MSERVRAAAAGAVAATVWGLQEPLDERVFRCDYSDIAVLGKAVTRGPGWRPAGFAIHAVNGAIFGLAFRELRRRVPVDSHKLAVAATLGEHLTLYPLCYFIDRHHPARGEPGIPPLFSNPRAFAQATWRHTLFGFVLGRLGPSYTWGRQMKLGTRIAERRRQKARERHLLERERQRALGEQDVQEAIRGTAQGSAASQHGPYGQN